MGHIPLSKVTMHGETERRVILNLFNVNIILHTLAGDHDKDSNAFYHITACSIYQLLVSLLTGALIYIQGINIEMCHVTVGRTD